MNNAKMWLVVKPTVGVPLFLSAVAIGSFAVHVAVLSNTTWVADFLSGQELGSGMAAMDTNNTAVLPASVDATTAAPVYIDAAATTEDGMLVILPDGRTARLVIDQGVALASSQ
ncbi:MULTISPECIES: light-harvesting protein [Paracoccaceae]|jgi:light-harvesting protein B-800-850 alpha chain|uniref:Antenna pigment protein alpha chain n=1 Tax=Rhodophyticola porphyridii TaxID=1852017 RepID=A0A3L9Y373_9RHOB|nr:MULTISPECIES: light-harvesting protein [Paracoccaceae]MBO6601852.1 light-harvesting protein [Roseicyclus sp.]MBO6625770.1 light-harvesting protein [Roseicyclus sp.]MBO6922059.1 light-harvesting protein [Roseicyclus sp.]RMA41748.1 light-harvesting protein [Rhodophyticola porphyridii]